MSDRNPIILPTSQSAKPCCPLCKHEVFTARRIYGVVNFKCQNKECRNEWQGGLPQVPQDPNTPLPPDSSPPAVEQVAIRDRSGNIVAINEFRRGVTLTQAFRHGAKIPDGEDF